MWLGDYTEDHATVTCMFTTHSSTGAPVAPLSGFEAADVIIYKNGSGTQKTSTNGVTMTSPFDSITGLHCLVIDTSNDTGDAAFWVAGNVYTLVLSPDTETVDSVAVAKVIGQFGIELAGALRPATASRKLVVDASGLADANTVKVGPTGSGSAQTARDIGASVIVASGTVTTVTNQLTAAQIATGVWTDTVAGDFTTSLSIGKSIMNGVALGTGLTVAAVSGNVTFGNTSIGTVTNLTNLPSIPANWLTAAGIASGALDAVWSTAARTLTAGTNIQLPSNGLANVTAWTVAITGNITGNLSGSAGSIATGGITAASFADDAITAAKIAADAGTEIGTAVWATTTRLLTAGTNIVLAKGTGVTGFNDLSAAQVNAEADTALADYDAPTHAEMTAELATADDPTLAAIAALNNLSQADVRSAVGLASANLDTQLDALPTNAELSTALGTADDAVLAALAAGVTVATNNDKTGYSLTQAFPSNFSALGIGAGGHILSVDTLTTYTGNTVQTGDAYARVGAAGAGLTALGDTRLAHLDADVSSRLASGSYTAPDNASITSIKAATDNLPSDPADQSLIIAATNTLGSSIAALPTTTTVNAIKAKTDNLPSNPAAVGSAMTLTSAYDAAKTAASQASVDALSIPAASDNADAVFERVLAAGFTFEEVVRLVAAVNLGKTSGTQGAIRNLEDTANAVGVTYNGTGDRTAVTLNPA